MTVAFPWSGRDVQGRVPLSGRAAVHVPSGAGFNWRSVAGHSSGWVMPRGLRGLGQDYSVDTNIPLPLSPGTYTPGSSVLNPLPTLSTSAISTSSSQAPWYAPLIAAGLATGQSITNYELNPLLQKSTYYQTPQGTVYASNVGGAVPGVTTTAGSLMPLLLIGGLALVLVMGMARR